MILDDWQALVRAIENLGLTILDMDLEEETLTVKCPTARRSE